MKKRYAPLVPDAKWHRQGDTNYPRELIAAAGITQRKAAEHLGIDQRVLRYKLAGEKTDRRDSLSYPEQYVLEVLADRGSAAAVHEESAPPYYVPPGVETDPNTIWHKIDERPLLKTDAGKLIVGYDKFGATICGKLIADGFGLSIEKGSAGVGKMLIPIGRLVRYSLLDPPAD